MDSLKHCFDVVDQALADESAFISLDFIENGLEDHFQIVNAISYKIWTVDYGLWTTGCGQRTGYKTRTSV